MSHPSGIFAPRWCLVTKVPWNKQISSSRDPSFCTRRFYCSDEPVVVAIAFWSIVRYILWFRFRVRLAFHWNSLSPKMRLPFPKSYFSAPKWWGFYSSKMHHKGQGIIGLAHVLSTRSLPYLPMLKILFTKIQWMWTGCHFWGINSGIWWTITKTFFGESEYKWNGCMTNKNT